VGRGAALFASVIAIREDRRLENFRRTVAYRRRRWRVAPRQTTEDARSVHGAVSTGSPSLYGELQDELGNFRWRGFYQALEPPIC
jgi:hypothetical protein